MKKIIFLIMFLFLFSGCAGSKYFYWDVNLSTRKVNKTDCVFISFPDYMKSGYVAGVKDMKFVFLNDEIPESVENFYGSYLKKKLKNYGIGIKFYPWECNKKPKNIYRIRIIDYYIDLLHKKAVLKVECCGKNMIFEKKYKNDYLAAYKDVFDQFIKKIGGML